MAEIIDDRPYQGEPQQEQVPFITELHVSNAAAVKEAADQLLEADKPHANIPYVKFIDDTVKLVTPYVYPVELGAPTGPYIDGLLKMRKEMEKVEVSARSGAIPVKPEDEEAASEAINWFQRYAMFFTIIMSNFEMGLSPEQRWW